jgi:hypothetical protein
MMRQSVALWARVCVLLAFGFMGTGEAGPPWYTTTAKLTRVGTGLAGEGFYLELDVLTHDNSCRFKQSLMLPAGAQSGHRVDCTDGLAGARGGCLLRRELLGR